MNNPVRRELSEAITEWTKHSEAGIKQLDIIALMILSDFPTKDMFCKAKPFFEMAIASGFNAEELQLYSEQLPRKPYRNLDREKEMGVKRKRKKIIIKRIDVYWHRMLFKCFPPTDVSDNKVVLFK